MKTMTYTMMVKIIAKINHTVNSVGDCAPGNSDDDNCKRSL